MAGNLSRDALDAAIALLKSPDPRLTQAGEVKSFEQAWSEWLGVKHSIFVNSGSSANLLTLQALKDILGPGEVIVPALTWVSDIVAVLHAGFTPVFVDIQLPTLGMDPLQAIERISTRTKAVFLTHVLGYSAFEDPLLDYLHGKRIPLVEDVCESYGATFNGRKLGTFGLASNFSFYYAHHLSTVEGGMISTDDPDLYQILRMYRAHGLVRECDKPHIKRSYSEKYPDLNPEFIFAYPGFNVRSTEINAAIGNAELKSLDHNNQIRRENFDLFLANLDPCRYFTNFRTEGNCNYAFTVVLKEADTALRDQLEIAMRNHRVEFRRGLSGGGNQLRQPYLRGRFGHVDLSKYPNVEHVHFFGYYIGNFPSLSKDKILALCQLLNTVK